MAKTGREERQTRLSDGGARRWPRRLKIPLRSHVPRLGHRTPMPSLSNGTESPLFHCAISHSSRVQRSFGLILRNVDFSLPFYLAFHLSIETKSTRVNVIIPPTCRLRKSSRQQILIVADDDYLFQTFHAKSYFFPKHLYY